MVKELKTSLSLPPTTTDEESVSSALRMRSSKSSREKEERRGGVPVRWRFRSAPQRYDTLPFNSLSATAAAVVGVFFPTSGLLAQYWFVQSISPHPCVSWVMYSRKRSFRALAVLGDAGGEVAPVEDLSGDRDKSESEDV